jgi:membrane protease YdiL (CAAX protease family)
VNAFLVTSQWTMSDSSHPQRATDYVLMVLGFSASAFMEELVTRAYLITRLEQLLHSRSIAVVLSAALFALYHVYQGPERLLEIMILGLATGFLYLLIRRIWPFAIGHMLWNVVGGLHTVA